MAGVTIASTRQGGRQAVSSRLATLARAVERTRGRRQWDVRQIMLVVGSTLMGLGIVAIVLGWYGAAHSSFLFQEIPYLISGGLLGVALVAGGGFLFFGAWLIRLIEEYRRSATHMARTLDNLDRTLAALVGGQAAFPAQETNGLDAETTPGATSPEHQGPTGGGWA
jgi:hypothetical protein